MKVTFKTHKDKTLPPDALAEAEIVFDGEGPLVGIRIGGFLVWREGSVDLPIEMRLNRNSAAVVEQAVVLALAVFPKILGRVQAWILDEYNRQIGGGPLTTCDR